MAMYTIHLCSASFRSELNHFKHCHSVNEATESVAGETVAIAPQLDKNKTVRLSRASSTAPPSGLSPVVTLSALIHMAKCAGVEC